MVESKFHLQKVLGMLFILIGLAGFAYLAWTYVAWGAMLPKFDGSSLFESGSNREVQVSGGGFAALLGTSDVSESSDRKEPFSEDAEGVSADESHSVVGLNRTLGERTVDNPSTAGVFLSVPRLGIQDARVELDVDGENEAIYDTVLTRALAHLQKSAYPGEYGNTFIFGHSKLPVLAGSDYESIFTNLPKVKVGDLIKVRVDDTVYVYQVMQTGVVNPSDVFIMNQPETKKMLTLMTCIPPGFANQRYITVAELIDVQEAY